MLFGDNSIVFKGLYVIPNIMMYSVNQRDGVCCRSDFKNFLKFYEEDFGQISMKTLESELDLWGRTLVSEQNLPP